MTDTTPTTDTTTSTPTDGGAASTPAPAPAPEPAASADPFEGVDIHAEPVNGGDSMDQDLVSRYGDVLPDVLGDIIPRDAKEESTEETTQPEGNASPAEGQGDPSQPATQPIAQPQVSPEIAALQQQIAGITNLLNASQGGQQQQAPATQAQQQAGDQDHYATPGYDFEIPDQLINALASEEPTERRQAISAVMKGVAQTVHQQVMQSVKSIQSAVPDTVQAHIHRAQEMQRVNTEFYQEFPQLNTPELRPVVMNTARTIIQAAQAAGQPVAWTPAFAKQVGTQVMQVLGMQQAAPAAPAPIPAPPTVFGGSAAGGASEGSRLNKRPTTQQDYMNEL